MYVAERILYVKHGSDVQIQAITYASGQDDVVIEWYHEGAVINTTDSGHFAVNREGLRVYTLNITDVDLSLLGSYKVVITVGGNEESDAVVLMLPGKARGVVVTDDVVSQGVCMLHRIRMSHL